MATTNKRFDRPRDRRSPHEIDEPPLRPGYRGPTTLRRPPPPPRPPAPPARDERVAANDR